jgi:cytochrome c553
MIQARSSRVLWMAIMLGALVALGCAPCRAGDVKAGRVRAQACQACHGMDGVSKVPDAPNLAGQVEGYLATQLQAFKSGSRKSEAMSVVSSTLSAKDIDDLAAYFAAIEVKVGPPPS